MCVVRFLCAGALVLSVTSAPLMAQDRGAMVFGEIGGASLGHADSEQGRAPIWGGGLGVVLTRRMVAEVDVQRGAVDHVFGREHHNFDETTITGRIMFRTHPRGPLHVLAGGGLAVQRAHAQFEVPPLARVNRVEWLRLWHGRAGVDCDVTPRLTIRTHGSLSMGGGLDWILGGGVGLGYRF